MTHLIEIFGNNFKGVSGGYLTSLVVKNDRKYMPDDTLIIQGRETTDGSGPMKELNKFKIDYILNGDTPGLKKDYIVLSIKEKEEHL